MYFDRQCITVIVSDSKLCTTLRLASRCTDWDLRRKRLYLRIVTDQQGLEAPVTYQNA